MRSIDIYPLLASELPSPDTDVCYFKIITIDDNNRERIDQNNLSNHIDLNVPKPTFRLLPGCKKRKCTALNRRTEKTYTKDSYYHYHEPTAEELMDRVEYDMDKQDEEWLKLFNTDRARQYGITVSEDDFEKIMDRLEKESFFESKKSGKEMVSNVDANAVCAICEDGQSQAPNLILFCDMCDLAVHQECYGVPYIPEGQWLCRRCLQSPSKNVSCVFCPNKGGAFKQTDDGRWAHVICALWIPEVCFANTVFLEPIDSIDNIPAARWRLTCYICKQKKSGACIQCHKPNCYVPFHVTCAQQAGLYMKMRNCRYANTNTDDVQREAFCDAHEPANGNFKRSMYITDSDSEQNETLCKKRKKLPIHHRRRDNMKKTRKILAEKRETAFNPVATPSVKDEKLVEISQLLSLKASNKKLAQNEQVKREIIRSIKGYWIKKREERNGVPLLRRLQVSYNNSIAKEKSDSPQIDSEKFERIRYDLEKARLLVGEVKKREAFKKRLFRISKEIVDLRYRIVDDERALTCERSS